MGQLPKQSHLKQEKTGVNKENILPTNLYCELFVLPGLSFWYKTVSFRFFSIKLVQTRLAKQKADYRHCTRHLPTQPRSQSYTLNLTDLILFFFNSIFIHLLPIFSRFNLFFPFSLHRIVTLLISPRTVGGGEDSE
jgi:hypothetical protein